MKKSFKDIIKNTHIKKVGKFLPFYWYEYTNGVDVIVRYDIIKREIVAVVLDKENKVNLVPFSVDSYRLVEENNVFERRQEELMWK